MLIDVFRNINKQVITDYLYMTKTIVPPLRLETEKTI